MKRYNIELSEKAETIYKSVKRADRSSFVSSAIIEKHERSTGTDLAAKVNDLERRIAKLEGGE